LGTLLAIERSWTIFLTIKNGKKENRSSIIFGSDFPAELTLLGFSQAKAFKPPSRGPKQNRGIWAWILYFFKVVWPSYILNKPLNL
jgi:hypothetical protein